MKRNFKKVFGIILLCVVLITGCGTSEDVKKDEPSNSGGASTDTSSPTADKITLAVWNEPNPNKELDMYAQAEIATGIEIEVVVIPESQYSSRLNQMVSTNDNSIDIYVVWENDIGSFAEVGGVLALDDYLENSTIKTDEFIDAVAQLSSGLGGTYGLPWCAATQVMYYNKDMFDAAGLEYPSNDWAYADYLQAVETLTIKAGDGTSEVFGSALPNTQTWWAGIGGGGDQVYDPATGQMVIGDSAVAFINDMKRMVENGFMPQPSSDTADLFAAGRAAMAWQGSWNIGAYGNELGFNWDIATIPTNLRKYNTLHTGFYTINSNSKNQDAAFKVIEYLMSDEGQAVNSKASGNPSAIISIAEKGEWKVESAVTIKNWEAITDSLGAGVFGYTCLPSGVTNNAIGNFESAVLGMITPEEAVENSSQYAKETIGY